MNERWIGGEVRLKEYICVEVGHQKIAEAIEEYQRKGWRFHTYQATGDSTPIKRLVKQPLSVITCCLKEANKKPRYASII